MPNANVLRFPYAVSVVNEGALRLSIYNPKTSNTLYAGSGEMVTITAYENNYGYDLMFTVTDVDKQPFNLTGATVKFKMCKANATTLKVNGDVTLVSPTDGTCAYTTTSTDFDTSGTYLAEVEISVADKVYTIGGIEVEVIKELPRCS